jgi:hypothetical protein
MQWAALQQSHCHNLSLPLSEKKIVKNWQFATQIALHTQNGLVKNLFQNG